MNAELGGAAYFAQHQPRVAAHLSSLDQLRHHSFLNVGLQIDPSDINWSDLLQVGAARIDYSGCYSNFYALICRHADLLIDDYLSALPPRHFELHRPLMERALRAHLAGDLETALAEVDRIIAPDGPPHFYNNVDDLVEQLNNPAPDEEWPTRPTRKEAAFFCAAYLRDAERFDQWATAWGEHSGLTPHEEMTAHRLLDRPESHAAVLQRIMGDARSFADHMTVARTIAQQSVQDWFWSFEKRDRRFKEGCKEDAYSHHRELARRMATTANEWCRLATQDFTYAIPEYSKIPDTILREYLDKGEAAAVQEGRSIGWRVCSSTCASTLGDLGRARDCIMQALPVSHTVSELIACSSLCLWYGIGAKEDREQFLDEAERLAVTQDDFVQCVAAWSEAGELGRADALRRRLGATAFDDDLEARPPS